jgi:outer membrane murein-binding lipoprotein Lpp
MTKKLIFTISFIVLSALILVSCSNKAKTPMPISESSTISSVESQSENEGTTNTQVQKLDETSKEKSVSKENEQKPSDSAKGNNKNTSTSPKKSTDKTEKETPTRTNAKSVQSSSTTIKQTRKETTTKKVTTTQKSFDVNHYVSYAKNYAKSIGLNLDSGCTDCWDNPINANANCSNIERDIKSRLNRYKNVEGFTDVWIWAESTGNGNYNIYIGYA